VDSASGIIRTVKALDRETVSRYDLMVLATDSGSPELTGKTNVKIEVQDGKELFCLGNLSVQPKIAIIGSVL